MNNLTYADALTEAKNNIELYERETTALLIACEKSFGIPPEGHADEKTWKFFADGRFVCPFFTPDYQEYMPRPHNFDELAEYVARGFFIEKDFTVSQLLFLKFSRKPNRLVFREDVDAFFEESFGITHEEAQKIVRDIRNPCREEQGKRELRDLCQKYAVSAKSENALYREILRTRPTYSKKSFACAYADYIYKLAYYQANYPDGYTSFCF